METFWEKDTIFILKKMRRSGWNWSFGSIVWRKCSTSFHSGFKLTDRAGNQVLVSQLTGKISGDAAKCENGMAERGILFWLEEDREPTVHILNEMMDLKEKI